MSFSIACFWTVCLFVQRVAAQMSNSSFSPWEVMGPVNTTGTGYAVLTYVAGGLDYDFHLFNVSGLKSIELHVGAQTEHGDVATVFYKTAFANGSQISQGRVAAGTLTSDDLIGPFVLPLGEHLDTSVVFDRYISMGFSTVVVHTLMNPGGELGAYPTIMNGSASMNMGANVLTPMGGPSAMSTGMQGPAPKSSVMPMHMGMGM